MPAAILRNTSHKSLTPLKRILDAERFKQLVMPHYRRMFTAAIRLTADTADAQDAVQDAVVRLWQQQSRLEDASNIEAYAVKAAHNAAIDIVRRRHPVTPLEGLAERDTGHDPSKDLDIKDRVERVMEIIEDLPEAQRRVILMRDVDGLELEEIARDTGYSNVNVRALLSRARAKIRKHFVSI